MRLTETVLAVALVAASHGLAAAQVDTISQRIEGPLPVDVGVRTFDEMNTAFSAGDMKAARIAAQLLINGAKAAGKQKLAYDVTTNRIVMVWVGLDSTKQPVVRRLLLPEVKDRPYSLDLGGLGDDSGIQLFELFVSTDNRATLATVYRSTREDDPLAAQAVLVAERIMTPLFGLIGGVAGEVRAATLAGGAEIKHQVFVTTSRVIIPYRRASVSVTSVVRLPKTPEQMGDAAADLAATMTLTEVPQSRWAKAYAIKLARSVTTVVESAACTDGKPLSTNCLDAFDNAFSTAFEECQKNCVVGLTPTDADTSAMRTVDKKFRDFAASSVPTKVEGSWQLKNHPTAHFSFGIGTGVILKGKLNKSRVKVNEGTLVADPLPRQITWVGVNWSPGGYDADAPEASRGERNRIFLGALLTPDFGVTTGYSVLLVRGLAVNAGVGVLFTRGIDDPSLIGQPPTNAADPFVLGTAGLVFVGASFNFK